MREMQGTSWQRLEGKIADAVFAIPSGIGSSCDEARTIEISDEIEFAEQESLWSHLEQMLEIVRNCEFDIEQMERIEAYRSDDLRSWQIWPSNICRSHHAFVIEEASLVYVCPLDILKTHDIITTVIESKYIGVTHEPYCSCARASRLSQVAGP